MSWSWPTTNTQCRVWTCFGPTLKSSRLPVAIRRAPKVSRNTQDDVVVGGRCGGGWWFGRGGGWWFGGGGGGWRHGRRGRRGRGCRRRRGRGGGRGGRWFGRGGGWWFGRGGGWWFGGRRRWRARWSAGGMDDEHPIALPCSVVAGVRTGTDTFRASDSGDHVVRAVGRVVPAQPDVVGACQNGGVDDDGARRREDRRVPPCSSSPMQLLCHPSRPLF